MKDQYGSTPTTDPVLNRICPSCGRDLDKREPHGVDCIVTNDSTITKITDLPSYQFSGGKWWPVRGKK